MNDFVCCCDTCACQHEPISVRGLTPENTEQYEITVADNTGKVRRVIVTTTNELDAVLLAGMSIARMWPGTEFTFVSWREHAVSK